MASAAEFAQPLPTEAMPPNDPSTSAVWFYPALFAISALLLTAVTARTSFRATLVFMYSCFIRPFITGTKANSHQAKLEAFYSSQAHVYDTTRRGLLRGRDTMLRLCAAQLRVRLQKASKINNFSLPESILTATKVEKNDKPTSDSIMTPPYASPLASPRTGLTVSPRSQSPTERRPLIWVDLGSGTGWNAERMDAHFDVKTFDRVFLVDLCPSLCNVARERVRNLGWTNVEVICDDASKFKLPEPYANYGATLVTFSYSLSMIDNPYPSVDNAKRLLAPDGFIGVADFYVSGRSVRSEVDGYNRKVGALSRMFWSTWFELDNIFLHPSRREYLEHQFDTVLSYNGRNKKFVPLGGLVSIPYYVWIGEPKTAAADKKIESSEISSLPTITNIRPAWRKEIAPSLLEQFTTYIYAFAWEDPREDLKVLDLKPDSKILSITSGGCNILEYSLCKPAKIHSVDMNPTQNHLLELKLACITVLEYEDFWKLFGEGRHPDFLQILDDKLSPYLSSACYSYWHDRAHRFTKDGLYYSGWSGHTLRLLKYLFKLLRIDGDVHAMCHATDLATQTKIWEAKVRPALLESPFFHLCNNRHFLWRSWGVPPRQADLFMKETTPYNYIKDTLDPVPRETLFNKDQYFYYLSLIHQYHRDSCPTYLTAKAFAELKQDLLSMPDATKPRINIHTNSIIEAYQKIQAEGDYIDRAVLMDHIDWFDDAGAEEEIAALTKVMKTDGIVLFRSAAKRPFYISLFEKYGFEVKPIAIRGETATLIDRVNMYASFYVCTYRK